jgi:hypothetical protein
MTAKEKLRERVEDLTEQEAEATLEFIAAATGWIRVPRTTSR